MTPPAAELLSMESASFVALYGEHAAVHERDLVKHSFAGGNEPDPVDFWLPRNRAYL